MRGCGIADIGVMLNPFPEAHRVYKAVTKRRAFPGQRKEACHHPTGHRKRPTPTDIFRRLHGQESSTRSRGNYGPPVPASWSGDDGRGLLAALSVGRTNRARTASSRLRDICAPGVMGCFLMRTSVVDARTVGDTRAPGCRTMPSWPPHPLASQSHVRNADGRNPAH